MKGILLNIVFIVQGLTAQTIKGNFPQAIKSEICVKGFEAFGDKVLSKTTTDSLGNFTLTYPKAYKGAALLQIQNASSVIVLLNHENMEMQWENFKDFNTLKFINSPENDAFSKGIICNQESELKLNGLKYLLPQYKNLPQQQWLTEEIANQEQQFSDFLNQLPKESYAKYYLKIRKLITDFPQTANRYIERMPQHETDFNTLNFNEPNLYTSGLLKEFLEGYFKLMESHLDSEKMYQHINISTDAWIKSLIQNPTLQQEIAQYLFNYFEKRSLFPAAEHLALSMLNQTNCQLSDKSINLFEQYRKLAVGKKAPNIVLNQKISNDLKNIKNKYKLVVFGASWCPNCQTDYPKLKDKYNSLKANYDLEIIYISVDTDKKVFDEYYNNAPFITFCDVKGWDSQAAKDYHVFATPTYFLLDNSLKIVAKINSPEHLEAWLLKNAN